MIKISAAIDQVFQQFEASDLFYGHGSDNPWDEAVFLVLHCAGLPLDSDDSVANQTLTADQWRAIQTLADTRVMTRKPLPYLIKRAFFAGLEFEVDERVIIPRSPIAELIHGSFEPWCEAAKLSRVLDLCCGSACIAIAIAHYFPNVQVDAIDLSTEALAVAKQNVARYDLADRVRLIQSDVFQSIPDEKYDLIVSNPPYVDAEDMGDLPAEFHHEPEVSLASGEDGLDLTREILAQAAEHLTEKGVLICEVGNSAVALEAAYPNLPFTWIEFESGGHGVFCLSRSDLLKG